MVAPPTVPDDILAPPVTRPNSPLFDFSPLPSPISRIRSTPSPTRSTTDEVTITAPRDTTTTSPTTIGIDAEDLLAPWSKSCKMYEKSKTGNREDKRIERAASARRYRERQKARWAQQRALLEERGIRIEQLWARCRQLKDERDRYGKELRLALGEVSKAREEVQGWKDKIRSLMAYLRTEHHDHPATAWMIESFPPDEIRTEAEESQTNKRADK